MSNLVSSVSSEGPKESHHEWRAEGTCEPRPSLIIAEVLSSSLTIRGIGLSVGTVGVRAMTENMPLRFDLVGWA